MNLTSYDLSFINAIIENNKNRFNQYIKLVEITKTELADTIHVIKKLLRQTDNFFEIKTFRNLYMHYVIYIIFYDPYVYPNKLKWNFFKKVNQLEKFENMDNHLISKIWELYHHIQKLDNTVIIPLNTNISEENVLLAECILRNYKKSILSKKFQFKICKKCQKFDHEHCLYDVIGIIKDFKH